MTDMNWYVFGLMVFLLIAISHGVWRVKISCNHRIWLLQRKVKNLSSFAELGVSARDAASVFDEFGAAMDKIQDGGGNGKH